MEYHMSSRHTFCLASTGCRSEETVRTRGCASLFKCSCEIVLRRSFASLSDESPFTLGGEDVYKLSLRRVFAEEKIISLKYFAIEKETGSRKIGRSPAADWAPRPSVCRAPDVKKIRCRGRQRISSAARLDRLPTLTWPIYLLIASQTRYYNRVLNITGLFVRGTRKSSKIRKVNIQLVM